MDASGSGSQHRFRWFWRAIDTIIRLPGWTLIGLAYAYRWTIGPLFRGQCRFRPSCSLYFIQSVQKYGAIRGFFRGVWRICRCNPWHPGGDDPP